MSVGDRRVAELYFTATNCKLHLFSRWGRPIGTVDPYFLSGDIIYAMKLIVGLGNPGVEYQRTRHNFGFMALDEYARHHGAAWHGRAKFSAEVAELDLDGEKVLLAKPQTFYNLVGNSVQLIRSFYKINIDDVLVIHDEMALPLGTIRTRRGGSDAGNNGIKNIINTNGAEFARVRIGSGLQPTTSGDTQPTHNRRDYVLGRLSATDQVVLNDELTTVGQIITEFIHGEFIETTYRA